MSERRGGIGLRTRLLALVLVPVVLLGALTFSSVAQRRSQADAAAAVERQVAELTKLVDLSAALLLARSPVEVEVRAGELGLDPGEALALLDLDRGELGDLDGVADALRASLPPCVPSRWTGSTSWPGGWRRAQPRPSWTASMRSSSWWRATSSARS
ncbi:MAG: hypothetical protein R2711_11400 [Acidimicrobiales bacterium]